MAKTYTKTQVEATEAMLLISKADRILANDRMEQQARNMTMEEWGCLRGCRYLLHDRDTKFCSSFRELIESGNVKPIRLPARSPNLNSYAERWVRSVISFAAGGKKEPGSSAVSRLHPSLYICEI